MQIDFNEEKHEYRVGGIITPSVSQILKANGLMGNFKFNETAMQNGTAIHKALELWDKGTLDMNSVDSRVMKCISLWEKAKKDLGIIGLEAIEKQVHFMTLFAGTIDRVAVTDSNILNKIIIDFKTGNPQKWGCLQTAGYAWTLDVTNPYKFERMCMKIHWDMDRVKIESHTNRDDLATFMSMANVYHWKKNNGYLEEK